MVAKPLPPWEVMESNQLPVPASDLSTTVRCTFPIAGAVCTGLDSLGPCRGAERTGWKNLVVLALEPIIHVRSLACSPYRGTNNAPGLLERVA